MEYSPKMAILYDVNIVNMMIPYHFLGLPYFQTSQARVLTHSQTCSLQPLGLPCGQSRISFDMLKIPAQGLSFLLSKTLKPKTLKPKALNPKSKTLNPENLKSKS